MRDAALRCGFMKHSPQCPTNSRSLVLVHYPGIHLRSTQWRPIYFTQFKFFYDFPFLLWTLLADLQIVSGLRYRGSIHPLPKALNHFGSIEWSKWGKAYCRPIELLAKSHFGERALCRGTDGLTHRRKLLELSSAAIWKQQQLWDGRALHKVQRQLKCLRLWEDEQI